MKTLEEIQDQTEELWRLRAAGEPTGEMRCIWCFWAYSCPTCPLALTFNFVTHACACVAFAPYVRWDQARAGSQEERDAAEVLYRLLVDNREEILAKAREVQSEADRA
jgi:hypothetical protein